jgi:hypothetical protein
MRRSAAAVQHCRRLSLPSCNGIQVCTPPPLPSTHVTPHHPKSSASCSGVTTTLFSSPFPHQVTSNIRDFTAPLSDAEAAVPHHLDRCHQRTLMFLQVLADLLAGVFQHNRDEGRRSWEGR